MSGRRLPAPAGRLVDRSRSFAFEFDGRRVQAHDGDTLASALLASGIVHVGRSFKLHRPRGVYACGIEEPTALLDIGEGARRTPNTRATDIAAQPGLVARVGNAWPGLRLDLAAAMQGFAALLPAGFYYKTFMWPHWHWFEPMIRRMAGAGLAPTGADPDRYEERSRHAEVLVVGGGPAGLQAARSAAAAGRQVLLIEAGPLPLRPHGVEAIANCTALGLYDHRLVTAIESPAGNAVRERLWKIRAGRIVLAVGAFERPMLFADNDRPGVMLAGAVARYAEDFGVACGRRVVLATACDRGLAVAETLRSQGIDVAAVVDRRAGAGIVAVRGVRAVQAVTIDEGGRRRTIDADCIASAGGWTPAVHFHTMAGGRLRWFDEASMFVPDASLPGITSVGACAGVFEPRLALEHADAVGRGIELPAPVGGLGHVPANNATAPSLRSAKVFVDLQSDVTTADIELAARENYRSVEHLKRYTTTGMATDQGKTSNVNALVLMGLATGRAPAEVGTTKFRPPFKPATLGALAAARRGATFKPLRRLPAHAWHEGQGALMEDFGGWLRPAAYPKVGEALIDAAEREALQVRTGAGLFDASPLGKIELYGPDAADFLDRMYVGTMSTLAVGQARYGLLLDEMGVIVDDGIVARLGAQHFWVNTTSGGAGRIALAFEEWLQCEFVRHRVLVTPVTSCWGNVTIAGPEAWALLRVAGLDAAVSPAAIPHMTLREFVHDGAPMRVLRASYSGEMAYEINLPPSRASQLLQRLAVLGAKPYGIEALMILRTEKGYLHVGADTDGTTLPSDVGMDRGVAGKAADFVGRRSLSLPAARDPDRRQLVGLRSADGRTRLPVGAHIAPHRPPAPIEGHVTSSCFSPTLGRPIALAMLVRGRARLGERVTAYHLGQAIDAEVVATPFVDPRGERLHGRG